MVTIYVLELNHNKYYIGRTNNPEFNNEYNKIIQITTTHSILNCYDDV